MTIDTATALFKEGVKAEEGDQLVIDLVALEKVDSSAVSLMLVWLRDAQRNKINLRFINIPDNLMSLARLYGVSELLMLGNED